MIDIEGIERYVEQVIESKGLVKAEEEKQDIRLLLSRLFFAVGMYSMLTPEQNYEVAKWIKIIGEQFSAKVRLKEGKKRKRKEKSSPTPLSYKEIENPKEVQKTSLSLRVSDEDFEKIQVAWFEQLKPFSKAYGGKYENDMIERFFLHWSERVGDSDKMLWQAEKARKSWSLKNRIRSWSKKSFELDAQASAIRLEQAKKGKSAPVSSKEQQAQTARRAEANSRLEEQIAQAKAEAVPYEEYRRRLSEKFKTEK